MYPKERKFEFEFKEGAPWMHKDLIAEYDFPILKTDEQLQTEKDSIINAFVPFYVLDSTAENRSVQAFSKDFNVQWQTFWKKHNINPVGFSLSVSAEPTMVRDSLRNYFIQEIKKCYDSGIISLPDSMLAAQTKIQILDGAIAEELNSSELFQLANIDPKIQQKIKVEIVDKPRHNALLQEFIASVSIGSILTPNFVYDQETNDQLLNEKLDDLSLSAGLVQRGELIIQQGGIVDKHSFVVLNSLKKEYESNASVTDKGFLIFGIGLLYLATALSLFMFLLNFKPKILHSARRITFVLLQVILFTGLAMLISRNTNISIYVIPFVIVPMMVQTFFDDRTALFVHIIVVLMVGFVAPNGFEFVFIQMIAGIVAVFSLTNIQQRKRMFVTAFYVLLTYGTLFFSMHMLYSGGLPNIEWVDFAWFGGSALLILFAIPLIWVYEKLFGFVSDATLMELTDTNHPLLRQLAERAPGTFQHSMQVANLAEAVGRVIGGNPLLIRTGALYHDIGKAAKPEFFVENQSGFNPHEKLDFDESAQIIVSHVTRGVEMAKKAKLPESVIDFIRTHHGIGKAQFFYRSFKNKYPDREIDEEKFSYPGPSPRNIENAILMMADSIEAATRTLKVYNKESIYGMVSQIVDSQLQAGQFDHVDITLRKISKAKDVFTEKLLSIYHTRIEYPELKKDDANKEKGQ